MAGNLSPINIFNGRLFIYDSVNHRCNDDLRQVIEDGGRCFFSGEASRQASIRQKSRVERTV